MKRDAFKILLPENRGADMNKEHFLTELKIHLKALPKQQLAYILQLYGEKFDKQLAEGQSEAAISKCLGNPREIAEEILEEFGISADEASTPHDEWQEFTQNTNRDQPNAPYGYYQNYDATYERGPKKQSFFVRFCQVAGVLLFNFLFMIWMIIGGLALLFGLWIATIAFLLTPAIGVFSFFATSGAFAMTALFITLFTCGLGFIGLAIMVPITTYSFRFIKYYTKWNINTLRGRH